MKKSLFLSLLLLLCIQSIIAQVKRSDEFHQKYHLSEVVVFSRHNIRAPLAEPGSFISTITPHTWHNFGVKRSELTMKGGVLETINGQFFHQWVVSEGLFPENAQPTDQELVVIANSKQRIEAAIEAGRVKQVPSSQDGEIQFVGRRGRQCFHRSQSRLSDGR